MSASLNELSQQARSLLAAGRVEDALTLYRRAILQNPTSGVAEHNLAGALGDLGRWAEAERHLRSAFSKGLQAPETWLVQARCMQALARFDEADKAFREALRQRPAYVEAHRELVQMRWMRNGDIDSALSDLIGAGAGDLRLVSVHAEALRMAGRDAAALEVLKAALARAPGQPAFLNAAAQAALAIGEAEQAVAFAEKTYALVPNENAVRATLAVAYLAAGETERAAKPIAEFLRDAPLDQNAIALQATVWRLQGDPRYRELYDYDAFVRAYELHTPRGWPNLSAYLADLGAMLAAEHRYTTHPFAQSILHGSQAPNIHALDHPAAKALPEALDPPIRAYLDAIGQGEGPLRSRNTGRYRHHGMWSIRAKAGGFHIDHVHPQGWISSACYVEVPANTADRAGWIKFGEPGSVTRPRLVAEHAIEPRPGRLVLFPSYMWHGTIPFTGDDTRLTFAFDLLPA